MITQSGKFINVFPRFQCNNPQTKEAKLVAAERIISEWSEYDEDIKRVLAQHRSSKTIDNTIEQTSKTIDYSKSDKHLELWYLIFYYLF